MKEIKSGRQFKKDLKRYANQPKKLPELYKFVNDYLQTGAERLPKYHAHMLIGEYADYNPCS